MSENNNESVPAPSPPRPRKGGGVKAMFVVLIVLALAGIIVYLLSLINSKRFFLIPEGNQLVIKQGIFFPVGSEPYQSKDPEKLSLYRPIELPASLAHAAPLMFDDLPSLNRELGKHLIEMATEKVFSQDDSQYGQGKGYLNRAGKLHGLDSDQMEKIKSLRSDVDYIEAKRAYLGVERTLEQALKRFKKAEAFGTGRFGDTREWIDKIDVLLKAIRATKAGQLPLPDRPPAGDSSPPSDEAPAAEPAAPVNPFEHARDGI